MTNQKIVIVVPCYNEQEILKDSANVLLKILKKMIIRGLVSQESSICFVNDGSKDETWSIIQELCEKDDHLFEGIKLSRNFGHQAALLTGLYTIKADAYITIDADLQDDENCIIEMVKHFNDGVDIVYGVRKKRDSDSFFKRMTVISFYKFVELLGIGIIYNHADFRLMSRRSVETLKQFPERNLFLRAIVPALGFESASVLYDRKERKKGESKYPLHKMIAFAWEGITSFSVIPLRIVTLIGVLTFCFSILLIVYSIFRWFSGGTILGWTSLITIISIFSGVQLIALGIVGEYIGKIYNETKRRPQFIIQKKLIKK